VAWARDLANEPPGSLTPGRLGELALELAGGPVSVEVWDEGRIVAEGLGGLAGVARGSKEPPRLVRLEYRPEGQEGPAELALVGKGVTFDSGGLSLKSAEAMVPQKTDMAGAAAVVATMATLGRLGAALPVLGLVPAAENMPGPGALKPGDVVRARNAKTIEVVNTDAEGRLILADALCLAAEAGARAVLDVATLTGACVVALGSRVAGLMGNDQGWVARVKEAADRAGEPTWVLPLPEDYRSQLDSEVADLRNVGRPGQAGALLAGLVLSEFVAGVPWAHIDMAGPARSDADDGYLHKGATGFGVRTLLELAAPTG
jgi:leucyl aminopeptidase